MRCIGCDQVIKGKSRRGRCENCYRVHLRKLKSAGEYSPSSSPGQFGPVPVRARVRDAAKHPGELALRTVTVEPNGCWLYTGNIRATTGYGEGIESGYLGGKKISPHRAVYELRRGPIPPGLELDHVCHTQDRSCAGGPGCLHRRCVNPDHLEPVTPAENTRRGNSPTSLNLRKTHCIRGHEFTPENTYWRPNRKGKYKPSRQCRECRRIWRKRFRQK